MRIKKHKNGSQYLLTEDNFWVRNFTVPSLAADINGLIDNKDYSLLVENERKNSTLNLPIAELLPPKATTAVIISDGLDFSKKHKELLNLKNVVIFAVNRSLAKWEIAKKIDYYVINNPYAEAVGYLPEHQYHPRCWASVRTFPGFVTTYAKRSLVSLYTPTAEVGFMETQRRALETIDDYRNPICACLHLAYGLGIKKIILLACDDSFEKERPGAIQLENKYWTYPQQLPAYHFIDAMGYWLKEAGITVLDCSLGLKYNNIRYIPLDEVKKI